MTQTQQGTNRLSGETSPYLLQHKDNPVWWYAWGEEAFAAAKREMKPIFLSIGYSTCYWCHVMEKDSFENEAVAELLNKNFICIKVDREERPDVDQIYMEAVVEFTGQGGWPLSVFLTPDLKPFWGGTFFYKNQFLSILQQLGNAWMSDRATIEVTSSEITSHLQNRVLQSGDSRDLRALLGTVLRAYEQSFDASYGGFGSSPKFPPAVQCSLLLRLQYSIDRTQGLSMVQKTLDAMAWGGIYDHLGGGFHRYSTDQRWVVPHFEKMLYDNALLSVSYLEAYQVTAEKRYAEVASETLNYVLREMTSPEGGFYSAQDAGEVGKEGEYYVWKIGELESVLERSELQAFKEVYSVSEEGNFEGDTNILFLRPHLSWDSRSRDVIAECRQKLTARREGRAPPRLDDKVLTAWNGLMISALAKGYQVLGDENYLRAAQKAAAFLRDRMQINGRLYRSYRDDQVRTEAFCEDYAFLIEGLINLYESDFDTAWINWANKLQQQQDEIFWDEAKGGYFFTAAPEVVFRKKEFLDGAIPSCNSASLVNLLRLTGFFNNSVHQERAKRLGRIFVSHASRYPNAFPKALIGVHMQAFSHKEIAIMPGADAAPAAAMLNFLRAEFRPLLTVAMGLNGQTEDQPDLLKGRQAISGKTTFYICENQTCKSPLVDLEEAKRLLGR
ncbi:MAG: thioredoxin domain-containing protein [Deltaproteobacteria bacterium]|nr:thioredoxin domain-containing protein [Deltaproteobacteria bacterium]